MKEVLGYAVAVLAVGAALAVSHYDLEFSRRTPFLLYYPVPLLAYLYGGLGPGLVAALLSGMAVDYTLLPPYYSIGFHEADFMRVLLFVGIQAVLCLLLDSRNSALRRSEAQLQTIFDNVAEGVVVSDLHGHLFYWNDAAVKLHGFAGREECQRRLSEFAQTFELSEMDGTVLPLEQWPLSRILRGEHLREWEVRVRRRENHWEGIFSYGGTLVRDAGGEPLLAVMTLSDITQRKRTEQALRRSEERLRASAMAAEIGVWYWDPGTSHVEVSANWRRLFGIAPEAMVTFETWRDALHPEDRDHAVAELVGASEQKREFNVEYRVPQADGTVHWIVDRGRAWYDESGRPVGMAGVNVDITERKRAEAALIQSEKLASMGRMAATLAHEINNPLAGATNAVFLVTRDQTLSTETRLYATLAEQELRRAAQIARRTLGFFREPNEREAVLVKRVVDELVAVYEPRLKSKGIAIRVRYAQEDASVRGNAGELRQLFSNLVANSIDALADGGTVYVRVGRESSVNGAPTVRITFADTGTGIEPHHVEKIFEPFFTTKKDIGTGLGLWITQEIVKKHGGTIRVRSRVDKGAVFCITLPAAASDAIATSAGAQP